MRVERCELCQTELTLANTKAGEGHMTWYCARVLYTQRNAARDELDKVRAENEKLRQQLLETMTEGTEED
jgi:hypothetical protein